MFNLRTIAWKLCNGAKTHVMTSISIIAVAICLVVTMATYVHNAKSSLDATIAQHYGQMDILAGFDYGQGQFISPTLYTHMEQLDGVQAISPVSLQMTQVGQLEGVYTLGVENDALVKSRYHFERDLSAETIVVSAPLAEALHVEVGDTVMWEGKPRTLIDVLPTPAGAEPFQMALVANDAFVTETSRALFVLIETDARDAVVAALYTLQEGLRIDIVADYDFVQMNMQNLFIFIVVLSAFIVFVSGLLLLSTMQLLFTKLNGQLMILRSLGASQQQVVRLVRLQLLLIVVVGLVGGALLSVATIRMGLPKLIAVMELPEATTELPLGLICLVLASVGILLGGYMYMQMKKALHILPLQLARTQQHTPLVLTKWNGLAASSVVVIALLLLLVGQLSGDGQGALQILFGALLLAFVVLYFIPFAFQRLLNVVLQPVRALFGNAAYIACQQLIPQVRVNIKIVLSLVALVVILVFGSSMLKSIEANEQAYLHERFTTDYILVNSGANRDVSFETIAALQASPQYDVQAVDSLGMAMALTYDGESYDVFAKNLATFGVEGDAAKKIVVTESFAEAEQVSVGDTIMPYMLTMAAADLQQQDAFEIAAIVPAPSEYIGAYVDWTSAYAKAHMAIDEVKVDTADAAALQQFVQQYPVFHLLQKDEALAQSALMFQQRWSLFTGIFIVLLVATTIGIIQTLWHFVYTNRSQYTIQRMLGLSQNGLVKYVCMQVLTFTFYGLSSGLLIGALLTLAIKLIDPTGHIRFDYVTIGSVSGGLVLVLLIIFGLQGFVMSRKKLAEQVQQL